MPTKDYDTLGMKAAQLLSFHGSRMTLSEAAAALGVTTEQLREECRFMLRLDEAHLPFDLLSILPPEDVEDDDPPESDDDILVLSRSLEEIYGTETFDAEVLGPLYVEAEKLLLEEPKNDVLRSAVEKLRKQFLVGVRRYGVAKPEYVALLADAILRRRKVRIMYSRAWNPGKYSRVIEPYRLEETRRGFEVDAGPMIEGSIRTYLFSGISEMEVLEEEFELPEDVAGVCQSSRALTKVKGTIPYASIPILEHWAETVEIARTVGGIATFRAKMLNPVDQRCALISMLAPAAEWHVPDRDQVARAQAEIAAALREQHGL